MPESVQRAMRSNDDQLMSLLLHGTRAPERVDRRLRAAVGHAIGFWT